MTFFDLIVRVAASLLLVTTLGGIWNDFRAGHVSLKSLAPNRVVGSVGFLGLAFGPPWLTPTPLSVFLSVCWLSAWWMSAWNREEADIGTAIIDALLVGLLPIFAYMTRTEPFYARFDPWSTWFFYGLGPLALVAIFRSVRREEIRHLLFGIGGARFALFATVSGTLVAIFARMHFHVPFVQAWALALLGTWLGLSIGFATSLQAPVRPASFGQAWRRYGDTLIVYLIGIFALAVSDDSGAAMIMLSAMAVALLTLSARRWVVIGGITLIVIVIVAVHMELDWRPVLRIMAFLDHRPGLVAHIELARYGIGNGGPFGGSFVDRQLPCRRSDSLYAGISSAFGFMPTAVLILVNGFVSVAMFFSSRSVPTASALWIRFAAATLWIVTTVSALWQTGSFVVVGVAPFGCYGPSAMGMWVLLLGIAAAECKKKMQMPDLRLGIHWTPLAFVVLALLALESPALYGRSEVVGTAHPNLEDEVYLRRQIDKQHLLATPGGPTVTPDLPAKDGDRRRLQHLIDAHRVVVKRGAESDLLLVPQTGYLVNSSPLGRALAEAGESE